MTAAKKSAAKKSAAPDEEGAFEVVAPNLVLRRRRLEPGEIVKRSEWRGFNTTALVESGHIKPAN